MIPENLNRKGQSFSMKMILGILLAIILGTIVLSLFLPTAEGVKNAGSCSSPIMQAIANRMADITDRSVIC
ncbi:MAG: hypothetical protein ABEJ98_05935 [Candidatus Nanohaloarchaea archaeon]